MRRKNTRRLKLECNTFGREERDPSQVLMKEKLKTFLGLVLLLFGAILCFSPTLSTNTLNWYTEKYIKKYDKTWNQTKPASEKGNLYKQIQDYNKAIHDNNQKGFCDAWSYTQIPIQLDGLKDNCYGYINIPKMDVKLPLYLGASEEHLKKGAAVLGETSIPIGGINSNSVIAGHRGYQGAPYFREIERLSVNDMVYITNPWEKLSYRVESIKIIEPFDNDSVKIQPGKDMITLITCHPYRSHGKYRYVVYCVRDDGTEIEKEQVVENSNTGITFESSEPDIRREEKFRKIGLLIIFLESIYVITKRRQNN